jgi:hypothetical protein
LDIAVQETYPSHLRDIVMSVTALEHV